MSFAGDYQSWKLALAGCDGYDDNQIIEKIFESSLKVAQGENVSERDSVVFDRPQYAYSVFAWLLRIAIHQNKLNVLDFGGALGSTYRDFCHFLGQAAPQLNFTWHIVEQPKLVVLGQTHFQTDSLRFHATLDECLSQNQIQVVLLSSVLQYLENPYTLIGQLAKYNVPWLIFDRTAFINNAKDRLTIQTVRPPIYSAKYPAWFLSQDKFENYFKIQFDLIDSFDSFESWDVDGVKGQDRGYVFKRRPLNNHG
ncbi:MAG: methyltransferase, TIGR04325 family [Anaerolineae bacterium]|nr:methyltransferase, TIGR04325 family [Anaerolineae bacterium]